MSQLTEAIAAALPRLSTITEEEAARCPEPGRWSKKEILGHLIDSAANNHQRFVRAQLAPFVELPGYQQESWVTAQAYQSEPWADLIQLWASYNRHLAHVIDAIPADSLANSCVIAGRPAVTLGFVIEDYVVHLRHHLEQIFRAS